MFDPDMAGLPPISSPNEEPMLGVTAAPGPQRTGMFGVKGNFRDILGTLGDAFLVQAGKAPVYRPKRDQERFADAMGGFFSGDSRDKLAALETAAREFPEETAAIWDKYTRSETDRFAKQRFGWDRAGALAGSLDKLGTKGWDKGRGILQQVIQNYGLEDSTGQPIVVPDQYDADFLAFIAGGAMTPYQQKRADQLASDTESKVEARKAATAVNQGKLGITRENVDSQIKTRGVTSAAAAKNAETNAQKGRDYGRSVDNRIANPTTRSGKKPAPANTKPVQWTNGKWYRVKNGKVEQVPPPQ